MHNSQMGLPLDPSIYIDIFIMEVSLRPFVIFGDIRKPRRDVARPLAHPWAGCLTEILSYVVPFEKFSWCIKPEDFRINISADLHGCPMSLRLFILLVFLHCSDLHLKLTNPTYFIVLRASAVSHTMGPPTPRLRRARGNASYCEIKVLRLSRQRNSPNSWRQPVPS